MKNCQNSGQLDLGLDKCTKHFEVLSKYLDELIKTHSKGFHNDLGKLMIEMRARMLFEEKNPQTLIEVKEIVLQAVKEWRIRNLENGVLFARRARDERFFKLLSEGKLPSLEPANGIIKWSSNGEDPDFSVRREIVSYIFMPILESEICSGKLFSLVQTAAE